MAKPPRVTNEGQTWFTLAQPEGRCGAPLGSRYYGLGPMKRTVVALCVLGLVACSTPQTKRVTTVAETPFNDLNVAPEPIPEPLLKARRQPYREPSDPGCAGVAEEISELDELLGPDFDAPRDKASRDMLERGSDLAGDAALSAFKGAAEGVMPFRSWVRKLSGAERYSKSVAAALAAGGVRRAFLKGMRTVMGCHTDSPVEAAADKPPPPSH